MLITKNNDDAAFVRRVDATSRVVVWAVNHANSPQIAKLGLSHLPGGAVDASGMKVLLVNGPGLTLKKKQEIGPCFGLQASSPPMLPAPMFFDVAPDYVAQVIDEMTGGGCDPVYAAEKLGLTRRDYDKVSGPKLCRAFVEATTYAFQGFNFPCFDADGHFTVRYVLCRGSIFEAKFFKFPESPTIASLLFAPRQSGIETPPNCDGTFTVNASTALVSPSMGWICTAGGVDRLEWEIIRRFEANARLVWEAFPDDPLLTKNNFSAVFSIVTEAKRHCVKMNVLRATAITKDPMSQIFEFPAREAEVRLLNDREIKKVARRYHLPIDPVWGGLPGEIDFDGEPQVRKMPPFWNGNRIAVFFGGMTSGEFMQEFVTPRIKPWIDCGRTLVIVDEKDRKFARQVHAADGKKVKVATFHVFKDEHVFLEEVPSQADMIFIVPPCGDTEMKVVTPEILDVCAQTGLPVGIFSRSEDAPRQEPDAVQYCVKRLSSSPEGVFCVKNMSCNAITRYTFSLSGVEETPGSEDEMRRGK